MNPRGDGPLFPLLEQDPELDARCHWCAGEGYEACPNPATCEKSHAAGNLCPCGSCGGSGISRAVGL
jgi:hypothetical protein